MEREINTGATGNEVSVHWHKCVSELVAMSTVKRWRGEMECMHATSFPLEL